MYAYDINKGRSPRRRNEEASLLAGLSAHVESVRWCHRRPTLGAVNQRRGQLGL
jgi:hypothetical protein